VPALAAVQNAEAFSAESVTKIDWRFSTEFSTVVLKTLLSLSLKFALLLREEPPKKGGSEKCPETGA